MGRWAVMFGRRERVDPDPSGDRTMFDFLVNELQRRAEIESAGWCAGLDERAKEMWCKWYMALDRRAIPNNIVGVKSRAPTIARKVAMLYAWDFSPRNDEHPFYITTRELIPAIKFAELHIKSVIGLSKKIADHPDARLRRSVLAAMETYGRTASLGQILGMLKMRKRPVVEILDALSEEGLVQRTPTINGYSYVLRAPVGGE